MQFKEIHIGKLIEARLNEVDIDFARLNNFLQCTDDEIKETFSKESIDAMMLLRWSKILEYDFFRVYSQHLIFYSPPSKRNLDDKKSSLPQFRKNIYTQEVIDFIIKQIRNGNKTKIQIIDEYGIPKTTLYKWLKKY